jgi:hypothetical protein
MVIINKLNYELSDKPKYKLKVLVNGKYIYFGSAGMEHYFDKTGLLDKKLNHMDMERRRLYLIRSAGIKRKDGTLTKDDKTSSNNHSRTILWDA